MGGSDTSQSRSCETSEDLGVDIVSENRNEVEELTKRHSVETKRITRWRTVVTLVVLGTAVAVTLSTYYLLVRAQRAQYEESYRQFSSSVGDAAVRQQINIRQSMETFAHVLTSAALAANASWPFFTLDNFEVLAGDVLEQARCEFLYVSNYVKHEDRLQYEAYAKRSFRDWIREGHITRYGNLDRLDPIAYHPFITRAGSAIGSFDPEDDLPDYYSMWTFSPPSITYGATNMNQRGPLFDALSTLKNETLVDKVAPVELGDIIFSEKDHNEFHSAIRGSSSAFPHGRFYLPVRQSLGDDNSPVVALLTLVVGWDVSMRNLLPSGVSGIVVVLKNDCGQAYTYYIDGPEAFFQGEGDLHPAEFTEKEVVVDLSMLSTEAAKMTPGHCQYKLSIYPSEDFTRTYHGSTPRTAAVIILCTFALIAAVFVVYDLFVQNRNDAVIAGAARSNAIVSSLFPQHIRDQLLHPSPDDLNFVKQSKPMADLFLETTILFADISGFTAWSSSREPSQVFVLLENVYNEIDAEAKKRRVFKVETIGDCYVAAVGIPDYRRDHAIVMARFSADLVKVFNVAVRKLEEVLGPDTSDLQIRVGIHSGPVTGGVLRGERSRFQLFGDTMNVCSRVESTGAGGRVHCSQSVATEVTKAGKGHWLVPREKKIYAKGLGELQTYWVEPRRRAKRVNETNSDMSSSVSSELSTRETGDFGETRHERMINWNTELLAGLLQKTVSRRDTSMSNTTEADLGQLNSSNGPPTSETDFKLQPMASPLKEVKEIIELPEFDERIEKVDDTLVTVLGDEIVDSIRDYVKCIANMYKSNPFHNFEHASHVAMSVSKLLGRIVAPSKADMLKNSTSDNTYGITGDPLTQFACVFAALIHDVDHCGVPNSQLVKENSDIAIRYENRSVAEQNSLDLAWNLLMQDRFAAFRSKLFGTRADQERFRALVVNSVMATDIVDMDLKALRNARWAKAFDNAGSSDNRSAVNRKATIVIEHLIQASDISHTMQHWHVYRKWNERLFEEMYRAFQAGRSDMNPAEFWANGELGFFDFYIIPLAKKLKDCGVFGVSSDEFLMYAINNRREWEEKGPEVVALMIEKFSKETEDPIDASSRYGLEDDYY